MAATSLSDEEISNNQNRAIVAMQRANTARGILAELTAEIVATSNAVATLRQLGTEDASPFWHLDTYLYLIYPTKNGKRQRRYIGSNTERVQAALAAIKRAHVANEGEKRIQALAVTIERLAFEAEKVAHLAGHINT